MKGNFLLTLAGSTVLLLILDLTTGPAAGPSLLPFLLLLTGLSQGSLALVAAAELSNGQWLADMRPRLLGFYPLTLLPLAGFLVFARHTVEYSWYHHQTVWLNPLFFISRNILLLSAVFITALLFARAVRKGSPAARKIAVVYLLVFIVAQTAVAFDWVMSFEYPWISTLFGAYFFIEAFYTGIALALLLAAFGKPSLPEKVRRDCATLFFGFSLLWAGQIFAQYLTIWYGNIPEETGYLVKRLKVSPFGEMSVAVLLLLFVIPFLVLISRRAKTSRLAAGLLVSGAAAGYVIEKVVMIAPAAPFSGWLCLLQGLILLAPLAMLWRQPGQEAAG